MKYGTIVAPQVSLLQRHLTAILAEAALYPLSTLFVRLTIHYTWAEAALCSTKGISRIGIKLDADNGLPVLLPLLRGTAGNEDTCHYETEEI
jgi:hypothetical protein